MLIPVPRDKFICVGAPDSDPAFVVDWRAAELRNASMESVELFK